MPSYDADIAFADAVMNRHKLSNYLLGEQKDMTAYEKTIIKSFMNIEYGPGASIEQLTSAYGYFGTVIDRIKNGGFEVPKDLQLAFDASERDLKEKIKDNRLREIKSLESKLEALLSADQKREKIEADLAKLRELVK